MKYSYDLLKIHKNFIRVARTIISLMTEIRMKNVENVLLKENNFDVYMCYSLDGVLIKSKVLPMFIPSTVI